MVYYIPVDLAPGRLRQEDLESEVSLGPTVRPFLKTRDQTKTFKVIPFY